MDFPMSGVFFTPECSIVLVALAATLVCVVVASFSVHRKVNSQAKPDSARVTEEGDHGDAEGISDRASTGINGETGFERRMGASMLEQLVPDVMAQVLSYLDFKSLCSLSMTNSRMRKAANNEDVWRTVYFKDFAPESGYITPPNGWKAYYATTRAIFSVNAEFFRISRGKLFPAMSRLWRNADYVKCLHDRSVACIGYEAVMESWRDLFSWVKVSHCEVLYVRARILGDTAWVTMMTFVNRRAPPFYVTNIYECHNGQWYIVLHHCTPARHYHRW